MTKDDRAPVDDQPREGAADLRPCSDGRDRLVMTDRGDLLFQKTRPVPGSDGRALAACCARGTRICAVAGEVAVEDLAPGDLVETVDAGAQPLLRVRRRILSPEDLRAAPGLRPVRIPAGALGGGLPRRDLVLSPQHHVLVRSRLAERMIGAEEVLVAALHLAGSGGIAQTDPEDGIDYWQLMFDSHQLIHAEGARIECPFTGHDAASLLGADRTGAPVHLLPP